MDKKKSFNMQPVILYKQQSTYSNKNRSSLIHNVATTMTHNPEKDKLKAIAAAHEFHQTYLEKNIFDSHYHQQYQQLQQSKYNRPLPNAQQAHLVDSPKIKGSSPIAPPVVEPLQAIPPKPPTTRSKNEEAINDLRTRIPEIENIFDIHSRIGNGTFSTVLLATLKKDRILSNHQKRQFAIKHHIPTSHPDRIMKELECMARIGGTENVVGINCCLRYNESVAFVMPYLAHDRFHDFFQKMDVSEVQFYMKNLFIALRHVHSFNVIHRDVKPSNFLYNRKRKEFLLVDFGLAQQVQQKSGGNGMCPHMRQMAQQQQDGGIMNPSIDGNSSSISSNKRPREEEAAGGGKGLYGAGIESGLEGAKRVKFNNPAVGEQLHESGTGSGVAFKMPLKQINEIQPANAEGPNACTLTKAKGLSDSSSSLRIPGGACNASAAAAAGATTNETNNNSNNNNNVGGGSKYNTNRNTIAGQAAKCNCYGNPQVCNICLVKKEVYASRAGTPGYRPPEVLLKYADQTTAVDIWAAGVIFLSILSSVYPFFKAPNDYMALAEMVTIFGDKAITKTAYVLDRLVTLSQRSKPLDLRKLCVRFRNRQKFSSPEMLKKHQKPNGTCEVCPNCDQYFYNCLCLETHYKTEPYEDDDIFPPAAYDLLSKLLEVNPHKRITAEEALQHPFITENFDPPLRLPAVVPELSTYRMYHQMHH